MSSVDSKAGGAVPAAGSRVATKSELHHLGCAGADDGVLGGQSAPGADDGGLRAGLRVLYVLPAIVFLIPTALVSAELASGWSGGVFRWVTEGSLAEHGLRRGVAPVRDDDLLLPDVCCPSWPAPWPT